MRLPGAVIFALLAVAPLPAQYWSVGGFGNVAFPGLGHAPAGGNPWGNVAFPGIPRGSSAFTGANAAGSRYGNLVPGIRGGAQGGRRSRTSGIYAFPVYVGGYGYSYTGGDQPEQVQPESAPASTPPVVINNYYGTPPPDQSQPSDAPPPDSSVHFYQAPSNSDTVAPAETTYYLIAFKDHTIYSAVAYYTEGDTLHYFTAGNVHNQVSLALVDRALTEQLNRDRNVDVKLP